ncbi:MAG: hypothetical protein U0X39_01385 [Bacteroidales bacterium]
MKLIVMVTLLFLQIPLSAQTLPGFRLSSWPGEQQMIIEDNPASTRILINAPVDGFNDNSKVMLVFYALPNGNSIEQTFGKRLARGDDWHFDIQHIGAQTRFLRSRLKDMTVVLVYLETRQKSWPAWVANTPDSIARIRKAVDRVYSLFSRWNPAIILDGHSGGGRFIFSYIDSGDDINPAVQRIAFLDSDYGYEDDRYGAKITRWLETNEGGKLFVVAYNDSVVIYNGKPIVSPRGGTWYRSKRMKSFLGQSYRLKTVRRDTLLLTRDKAKRIFIGLLENEKGRIYHTTQVELNGFTHSILFGTKLENRGYRYLKGRAYTRYISDTVDFPIRVLNIPDREKEAESGTDFFNRIKDYTREEREEAIFREISNGNIPSFLRNQIQLKGQFADSAGRVHEIEIEVMPDYLSVGNDSDFFRVPVNPRTAQRLADLFGASLLTSKLSDFIFQKAVVRPTPFNYIPSGNINETVEKFWEHNVKINTQVSELGGHPGMLVAGIKKDIILSEKMADRPGKVVIYGWHRNDGRPIQPVYAGHVSWYVDYSHGIRFINNQVKVDGKLMLLSDILVDPLLFTIFSDEDKPMKTTRYSTESQ